MRPLYTARRLRDVGRALRLARGLSARERWTRDELVAHQQRQLSALVRDAAAASPFYRERCSHALGDVGIALDELPVLTKSELMASFDRLVTDPRLRLAELEAHVAGLARDEYYRGEYRVMATSGTTGERALIVYGRREWCARRSPSLDGHDGSLAARSPACTGGGDRGTERGARQ